MMVVRPPGVVLEPLGDTWVAFSPLSGETHLLNDTSAAILECLAAQTPMHADALYGELAALFGISAQNVAEICITSWPVLLQAGVVRIQRPLRPGDGR